MLSNFCIKIQNWCQTESKILPNSSAIGAMCTVCPELISHQLKKTKSWGKIGKAVECIFISTVVSIILDLH